MSRYNQSYILSSSLAHSRLALFAEHFVHLPACYCFDPSGGSLMLLTAIYLLLRAQVIIYLLCLILQRQWVIGCFQNMWDVRGETKHFFKYT